METIKCETGDLVDRLLVNQYLYLSINGEYLLGGQKTGWQVVAVGDWSNGKIIRKFNSTK
jgi:hypothetical protein